MDESVALDSAKQKDFVKSVKGIKRLLKKKQKKPEPVEVLSEKHEVTKEPKIWRKGRGLVYLSHIPHGFYEHQMTEYFKQFGVVTNARVIRSRRTGNSKGFAFVEFKEPAVAEIVAETMNNYLMGKRLIKAAYIPPHKQKIKAMRKKWNTTNNPARQERLKFKKMHNADKSADDELKIAKKILTNISNTKMKLSVLGIDYDFFKPVDIPQDLQEEEPKEEKKELNSKDTIKEKIKTGPEDAPSNEVKIEKKQKKQNKNKSSSIENLNAKKNVLKCNKEKINTDKTNNLLRGEEQQIKKGSVKKGPENYVSIRKSDDDDDDDSNIDFDSDAFEDMIENDEEDISSGDESSTSEDKDIKPVELTKTGGKRLAKVSQNKKITKLNSVIQEKQTKTKVETQPMKRKNVRSEAPILVKKTKFDKKTKRPMKNMVKKRK